MADEQVAIQEQAPPEPNLLAVKVADAEQRIIEGYATVWNSPDRQGEQMTREAIEPYLDEYMHNGTMYWEHQKDAEVEGHPIGRVLEAKCDDTGLWIKAQIYKGNRYVEYAWNYIKQGIRGLSVGAIATAVEKVKGIIKKWPLFEISVTANPAVPAATFSLAKALAMAKSAQIELDPQLSAVQDTLDNAAQRASQAGGAIKAQWQEAIVEMQSALEADDIKRVNDIYDQTDKETNNIMAENEKNNLAEMQDMIAKTVAETFAAQKRADEEAAAVKAAEEQRIQDEVEKRLAATIQEKAAKNPALKRELYPEEEENDVEAKNAEPVISGPYDHMEWLDLATAYLATKDAFRFTGDKPSKTLQRALVAGAIKEFEAGKYATKSAKPTNIDPKMAHLVQPVIHNPEAAYKVYRHLKSAAPDEIMGKANELMGSDVSGAGDEWIPQMYSRQLIELIRNEVRVPQLFRTFEVTGESLTVPVQDNQFTVYKTAQVDDLDEMDWGNAFQEDRASKDFTSNLTLTPSAISALAVWTWQVNEQSLINMAGFLRRSLVADFAEALEEILISGDETTASSNISDNGNAAIDTTWKMLLFDGLRHQALVDDSTNATDIGALATGDFGDLRKLMGTNGAYAADPSKLVWMMDLGLYYKLLNLGEVLTQDKFGQAFTLGSGVIERIHGAPVIATPRFAATDSSGYINNTAESNTVGSLMCVRPDQGVIGYGHRMEIVTGRNDPTGARYIVAHMSMDFAVATDEMVALGYNATV